MPNSREFLDRVGPGPTHHATLTGHCSPSHSRRAPAHAPASSRTGRTTITCYPRPPEGQPRPAAGEPADSAITVPCVPALVQHFRPLRQVPHDSAATSPGGASTTLTPSRSGLTCPVNASSPPRPSGLRPGSTGAGSGCPNGRPDSASASHSTNQKEKNPHKPHPSPVGHRPWNGPTPRRCAGQPFTVADRDHMGRHPHAPSWTRYVPAGRTRSDARH